MPVSLTVSPIRSDDGTVVGASKIARDVSERKRAEEERQRLLAIARDASRLKDEFLATLSHELRTPLNAIVGYVRMLQSGLLTGEKRARALDTVARNVTSLTQIVEDVLDVSRIISGKLRLDVQPRGPAAGDSERRGDGAAGGRCQGRPIRHDRGSPRRAGLGRSRAAPADSVERAVECRQVHAARRPRPGAPRAGRLRTSRSPSAIPGSAFRASSFRTSSSASGRRMPASAASAAGSASAWRSPGTWSSSRAGGFLPTARGWGRAPRSGSSCRCASRRRRPPARRARASAGAARRRSDCRAAARRRSDPGGRRRPRRARAGAGDSRSDRGDRGHRRFGAAGARGDLEHMTAGRAARGSGHAADERVRPDRAGAAIGAARDSRDPCRRAHGVRAIRGSDQGAAQRLSSASGEAGRSGRADGGHGRARPTVTRRRVSRQRFGRATLSADETILLICLLSKVIPRSPSA